MGDSASGLPGHFRLPSPSEWTGGQEVGVPGPSLTWPQPRTMNNWGLGLAGRQRPPEPSPWFSPRPGPPWCWGPGPRACLSGLDHTFD